MGHWGGVIEVWYYFIKPESNDKPLHSKKLFLTKFSDNLAVYSQLQLPVEEKFSWVFFPIFNGCE